MRNFNMYDVIFTDIDDTLIYGWWTRLMHITWEFFHNNFVSDLLMLIQERFNVFTVNVPLVTKIDNCPVIVALTARKKHDATIRLLKKIFPDRLVFRFDDLVMGRVLADDRYGAVMLCELATDDPAGEKWGVAYDILQMTSLENEYLPNCCIFDDNKDVRFIFGKMGYDAFDPTSFTEKKVV